VYLFGAQSDASLTQVNLSALTADQDFSSPDGLWFSPRTGLCFIQTDDGAYTDATNCMMLVGVPGQVGDGTTTTLSYTKADGSKLDVTTRVGPSQRRTSCAASWWARRTARSPASPRRRTAGQCL
jgi:secreted PhoX family phosphatase